MPDKVVCKSNKERQRSHPCTLASNELVVLCLHAGPAANIKVLGLKVGVVQLLGSLQWDNKGCRKKGEHTGEKCKGKQSILQRRQLGKWQQKQKRENSQLVTRTWTEKKTKKNHPPHPKKNISCGIKSCLCLSNYKLNLQAVYQTYWEWGTSPASVTSFCRKSTKGAALNLSAVFITSCFDLCESSPSPWFGMPTSDSSAIRDILNSGWFFIATGRA